VPALELGPPRFGCGPLGEQLTRGVAAHALTVEVVERNLDAPANQLGGQRVDRVPRPPDVGAAHPKPSADSSANGTGAGSQRRRRSEPQSDEDVDVGDGRLIAGCAVALMAAVPQRRRDLRGLLVAMVQEDDVIPLRCDTTS
jgi:hypothetical protein